jgi:hypothetical protein
MSISKIYKFRDKNGVLQYTDNFEDVPESQRDSENAYFILEDATEAESNNKLNSEIKKRKNDKSMPNDSILENLQKEKEQLDSEYEILQKRADSLNVEQGKLTNRPYDRALYEEKVKKLNIEIENYENRRKAFEKNAKNLINNQ